MELWIVEKEKMQGKKLQWILHFKKDIAHYINVPNKIWELGEMEMKLNGLKIFPQKAKKWQKFPNTYLIWCEEKLKCASLLRSVHKWMKEICNKKVTIIQRFTYSVLRLDIRLNCSFYHEVFETRWKCECWKQRSRVDISRLFKSQICYEVLLGLYF